MMILWRRATISNDLLEFVKNFFLNVMKCTKTNLSSVDSFDVLF